MQKELRIVKDLELNNLDKEIKVKLLLENFDPQIESIYAGNNWKTDKPQPFRAINKVDFFRSHVTGSRTQAVNLSNDCIEERSFRVGCYSVQFGTSRVKNLCIDIDKGPGHKYPIKDTESVVIDLISKATSLGLYPYLEKSKSGHGWHLWMFFKEFVDANKARRLGLHLCRDNYELEDGGVSDVRSGKGIELFPKQDFVEKGKFGNLVWLPWYYKAASDGNLFFKLEERQYA